MGNDVISEVEDTEIDDDTEGEGDAQEICEEDAKDEKEASRAEIGGGFVKFEGIAAREMEELVGLVGVEFHQNLKCVGRMGAWRRFLGDGER